MESLGFYDGEVLRKRGRPAGKRRMPLSREQKKARNAQYERERRNEIAEATCQLAEAAGFDESVSVANLLTSVIDLFKRNDENGHSSDSMEAMKQRNEDMEKEINELTKFLSKRIDNYQDELDDDSDSIEVHKRGEKRKSTKLHPNGNQKKQCLQENTLEMKTEIDLES